MDKFMDDSIVLIVVNAMPIFLSIFISHLPKLDHAHLYFIQLTICLIMCGQVYWKCMILFSDDLWNILFAELFMIYYIHSSAAVL